VGGRSEANEEQSSFGISVARDSSPPVVPRFEARAPFVGCLALAKLDEAGTSTASDDALLELPHGALEGAIVLSHDHDVGLG
jgi:hypothetical protein